jgi:hypothetical protein
MIQSILLCTISHTRFIQANVFTSFSFQLRLTFRIFSIINPIKIHHIKHQDISNENQFSSTASGNKCKKASHNKIPTEKAIKQTKKCFNFIIGIEIAKIQTKAIRLTINTAKIQ